MKIEPLSSRLYGILVLFEMHTDFLIKALDGIEEADAQQRLGTQANHIAWITGSLVHSRFFLAKSFGIELYSVTNELFANNRGIVNDAIYPSLADYRKDWDTISPILYDALSHAQETKLDEAFEMPNMKINLLDMIAFSTYREANCIGQIALWRRLLGYAGMNYM